MLASLNREANMEIISIATVAFLVAAILLAITSDLEVI